MFKRVLSFVLIIAMLGASGILMPVSAEEEDLSEPADDQIVFVSYTYLSSVASDIGEYTSTIVNCVSTCSTGYSNVIITMTCNLQKMYSGTWTSYQSYSATYGVGSGSHVISRNWSITTGYAYRTRTYVVVKNTSNTVLETATVFSESISM